MLKYLTFFLLTRISEFLTAENVKILAFCLEKITKPHQPVETE